MARRSLWVVLLLGRMALGQSAGLPEDVYRIGESVTSPQLRKQVAPQYSAQARDAQVQGTVLLTIVVDARGRPGQITVVSPLGFGLDEKAVAAISQWRFHPGVKDGQPVSVMAMVEVNFRLLGREFDADRERQRTIYNSALRIVRQGSSQQRQESLKKITELVQQEYPPAMHLLAELLTEGGLLPVDQERANGLIDRAAARNFGPAIYLVGRRHLDANPAQLEIGREMIERAANLGGVQAQYFLGSIHEATAPEFGYKQNVERSRHYFRLCAAAGLAQCQARLGRSLLGQDNEQAIAWLELAADGGDGKATELLAVHREKLTPQQARRVETLKKRLARRK